MYILIPTRSSSAVSTSPKSPKFARRHQPLPEYADVLITFLADLVLERALLADDLVPLVKSSLQLKPHIGTR